MRRIGLALFLGSAFACGTTTPSGPSDAGPPVVEAAPAEALSDWLSISDVAVYQGPKAPVYTMGAALALASMKVPVVGARPGMVRVYLHPLVSGHKPHHIFAELHVNSGGKEVAVGKDDGFISADSAEDQTSSTFNFQLDATVFNADSTYWVQLTDATAVPKGAPQSVLTLPSDTTMPLPLLVDTSVPDVKIVYIPVQYDADGSHRLPDTGTAQLNLFHDSLYRTYPATNISATVSTVPLPLSTVLLPNGTGWDQLTQDLIDRRAADVVSDDVYYIGLFQTFGTFSDYCASGCIGGIGLLQAALDPAERVAIVADYPVSFTIETMNQELAHDFGRLHAPCGNPQAIDPMYPYPDGTIGSWAWDIVNDMWIDPTSKLWDFMSYCHPIFVSDYTYSALFQQMKFVKKHKTMDVLPAPPKKMHAIRVLADGSTRDAGTINVPQTAATTKQFDLKDGAGRTVATGERYYDFDELGGGLVMVPENVPVTGIVRALAR